MQMRGLAVGLRIKMEGSFRRRLQESPSISGTFQPCVFVCGLWSREQRAE